jgi:isoquinoline 1-oxidoreductase
MSTNKIMNLTLEPERYELSAGPPYRFDLDRRDFFKFLGAGVIVVSVLKPAVIAQESGGGNRRRGESLPQEIDAWLHIGEDDKITVYTGKVEVGQNIRTSLSQAVSEELHVPIEKIELVMGDTQLTPFDMGTFGSRTTPTMNPQLRKVAAAARETLIDLAAKQWNTDRQHLIAADGKITESQSNRSSGSGKGKQLTQTVAPDQHLISAANEKATDSNSNRSIDYGALVKGKQLTQTVASDQALIPATNWNVAGQSVSRVDGRDFVTGKHKYPSDQKLPDMLYGKVVRPAAFGATLTSLDSQKAEQMGVVVVHDGDFVGVAASTPELAKAAHAAVHAEWKSEPQPSNKELFDYLRKNTTEGTDPTGDGDRHDVGSVDKAFISADQKLQQTYTVNYIAHVPLEPRAAVAKWDGDTLTVWTGTQRPFGVRGQLA